MRFGQIKRKLGLDAGAATKATPKSSAKKAGKSTTPGDDILGPNTTGAKVEKKPRKRTPAKAKAQTTDDTDDMPEAATTPSAIVKTEDTPVKMEEELTFLPVTPTPIISPFHIQGYRSSPLNYTDYNFTPSTDDGHGI